MDTSLFFQPITVIPPMATADVLEIYGTSYIGFDSITQQIEHKLLKHHAFIPQSICAARRGQTHSHTHLPYSRHYMSCRLCTSRVGRAREINHELEVEVNQTHKCGPLIIKVVALVVKNLYEQIEM